MYITTDMHILFVGFVAIALGFQVFRKSEEYCPYEQRMYVNVSAPSLILCATYCDVDKTGCARFVYDAVQEECIACHTEHVTRHTEQWICLHIYWTSFIFKLK